MKAAVYKGPRQLAVEELPIPEVGPYDILIKVKICLICGTDVKTYLQGHPAFKPGDVLGHEFTGVVAEVGRNVRVCHPGDLVTVAPYVNCGSCFYCLEGLPDLCAHRLFPSNGAFAEYVKISDDFASKGLQILKAGNSIVRGAFAEPIACVINSLENVKIRCGDVVVIIGAGPMGLLHVIVTRLHGAKEVIVSEPNLQRRELAKTLGAIAVRPEEVERVVRERTNGRGADRVILAYGNAELVQSALRLARPGARVALFGGFPPGATATIDPNIIHYKRVTLIGQSGFSPAQFSRAVALLETGFLPVEQLITHRFPLDQIEEAFGAVISQAAIKVQIDVDQE